MSNSSTSQSLSQFCQWLSSQHEKVMAFEKDALQALELGDKNGYTQKMRQKAEALASLSRNALPHLADMAEPTRMEIEHKLENFSRSASTAIHLGSTFYMSALLYRDDHKKGEPDNLQLFVEELKSKPM